MTLNTDQGFALISHLNSAMNMNESISMNGPPMKPDHVSGEDRSPDGKAVVEGLDQHNKNETTDDEEHSQQRGKPKEDEDDAGSTSLDLFRIDSGLLPFPEKLMALLDGDQVADAMWWLPDGDAFCLIPPVFAEKVLDKHFQGTKFESFTRKLNRWGFKRVAGQKVPANTIAYYNTHFIRGKPKLLKNMNGGKTKVISAREKRARAQMKRDRDREQAILFAAQQQALFGDRLNHSANSLFRPGLSSLVPPGNNVSDQLFAAELAAQQQRELQMQLALASRGALQGSNPLLMNHPLLQRPTGLTPEQQLLLARSGFNNPNPMVYASNNAGEESKMNGMHDSQQGNLRSIMAAKASEQQGSPQQMSVGNMDPQLMMLLQEQRMKELELLKMNRGL